MTIIGFHEKVVPALADLSYGGVLIYLRTIGLRRARKRRGEAADLFVSDFAETARRMAMASRYP